MPRSLKQADTALQPSAAGKGRMCDRADGDDAADESVLAAGCRPPYSPPATCARPPAAGARPADTFIHGSVSFHGMRQHAGDLLPMFPV